MIDELISNRNHVCVHPKKRGHAARAAHLMPTVLTWTYIGADSVDEQGDVQRCIAGDSAIDDVLGEVTVVSLNGGDLIVETGEKDADGKPVQKPRVFGHIKAKINRPEAAARAAPTGRPGQPKGAMFNFLGAAGAAASPTVQKAKPMGKAAKGLGKAVTGAKSPAAAAPTAAPKRKAPETPAVNAAADSDDEFDFGDNVHTQPDSLHQLGAEYADSLSRARSVQRAKHVKREPRSSCRALAVAGRGLSPHCHHIPSSQLVIPRTLGIPDRRRARRAVVCHLGRLDPRGSGARSTQVPGG